METLTTRSTSKLFSDNDYRERRFSSPRDAHVYLTRLQIRFLKSPPFFHSISLQRHMVLIQPISVPSASQPLTHLQDDETQIEDQSKAVHVKFKLERECSFGERFHIVGNDPMLGSWDPPNAIPMDWSDGHTWTVELDVPIATSIHYKFILIANSGDILWQPGPDRILQTWETKNIISVSEDWDNAELQKVIEEELVFSEKESVTNSESADTPMAIVAENITYPEEKIHAKTNNEEFGIRNITPMKEENGTASDKEMTSEESNFGNNGKAVYVENSVSTKEDGSIVCNEGVPILVLGLTPLPTTDTKEASPVEDKENTITEASLGNTKEKNVPELDLKDEPDSDAAHLNEATEMMHNDDNEPHGYEEVEKSLLDRAQDLVNSKPFENEVLENDIQWGRRTLQKFLANLGFL